jgi:hypothetical protein
MPGNANSDGDSTIQRLSAVDSSQRKRGSKTVALCSLREMTG